MTEKEKMLAGELYDASDPELVEGRRRARALLRAYTDGDDRATLEELFARVGKDAFVQPPFACDYGSNIILGERSFVNFNGVFLDCAQISIGDRVEIGPNVQLLTADHPRDVESRRKRLEFAKPIMIEDDTWVGGGAVVLPGLTVGAGSIVGAGSVVTRDVPPGVIAA
ncbi:MAG TPA: sugar O-acetyltransferase, partial [Thermoleophilaceae bacterium]